MISSSLSSFFYKKGKRRTKGEVYKEKTKSIIGPNKNKI